MKKIYTCIFLILLFSCFFSIKVLASNTTISLDVYEIVVSCTGSGTFYVDGKEYTGTQSFFRAKGNDIVVELKPNRSCKINRIICDTSEGVIIGYNDVTIKNVQNNIKIECEFKLVSTNYEDKEQDQSCDGGINCPINHFNDVDVNKWYHEDLDYVVEKKLMYGVSENSFKPDEATTRAMLVTILYRIEGSPVTKNKNLFIDVEDNTWYTNAILWASENNIVEGYGNNKFGPKNNVTREQTATILYRYAKYKNYNVDIDDINLEFNDVNQLSDWALEAMKWACYEDIIKGANGMLMPKNYTERCQIAAILHRFCE